MHPIEGEKLSNQRMLSGIVVTKILRGTSPNRPLVFMGYNMNWDFIWVLPLTLSCCSLVHSLGNTPASESLNSLVQDFAFRSLVKHKPQTGALYDALLPRNLSGMDISIVRLRSRRLWNKGANFSYFRIPPRTVSIPHVKRLAIVYQNLGNWSTLYYNLPGYSLISSVVGFLVFDASNVTDTSERNLTLNTMGQPISIQFPNITLMGRGHINSRVRCVAFNANGTFQLTQMSAPGVCYSRDQGHFSVVLPLEKKRGRWYLWVIGFVVGFFSLIIVGYAGFSSMRLLKTKRIQAMEKQANEDQVLQSRWVGNSKMPSAAVTRTQPVLECGVL
ncbi:hypothetical protein VIGAN_01046500 [Vigna angularis var. angularis]|uniref:Uncharacterized protein n=2 Tax=Phaseolus angularis TaxID=3914 RepID=A0A0S3QXJ9_PHAAN|nr:hypothetical protein VIGAN_01046500 [Vigna angularis var. angularis]